MITIRYFASLREQLGKDQDQIVLPAKATALHVWNTANSSATPPTNLLVAINQTYAHLDSAVNDGDEVAFFPPVTGG